MEMLSSGPGPASLQAVDDFGDRIEPVHDEVVAENRPSNVHAVLDADIDNHKRLLQEAARQHPSGKRCALVEMEIFHQIPVASDVEGDGAAQHGWCLHLAGG